jgi:chromosome segregation ATPase
MGVIALTEVVERLRKALRVFEYDAVGDEERRIEEQIASLQARLTSVRTAREAAAPALAKKREELEKKERLLALCQEDDRVAQAVWMQLLISRTPDRRAPADRRVPVERRVSERRKK